MMSSPHLKGRVSYSSHAKSLDVFCLSQSFSQGIETLTPPKVLQHHIQGGSAEGDAPGMFGTWEKRHCLNDFCLSVRATTEFGNFRHGHCKDQDIQDGLERGIGNGRPEQSRTTYFSGVHQELGTML